MLKMTIVRTAGAVEMSLTDTMTADRLASDRDRVHVQLAEAGLAMTAGTGIAGMRKGLKIHTVTNQPQRIEADTPRKARKLAELFSLIPGATVAAQGTDIAPEIVDQKGTETVIGIIAAIVTQAAKFMKPTEVIAETHLTASGAGMSSMITPPLKVNSKDPPAFVTLSGNACANLQCSFACCN